MNQKTNNIFTFNQIILNEKGNSYLGDASKLIGNKQAQSEFNLLLQYRKDKRINNLKYFVYDFYK